VTQVNVGGGITIPVAAPVHGAPFPPSPVFVPFPPSPVNVPPLDTTLGAVSAALADLRLPISRALCFVGGEWPPTMRPFMLRGVWIGVPVQVYRLVAQPGVLQRRDIEIAAELLETQLPPAG